MVCLTSYQDIETFIQSKKLVGFFTKILKRTAELLFTVNSTEIVPTPTFAP